MTRIRRWWRRGRVVWSEPARPRWLKVNPKAHGIDDDLQPGETTLAMQTEEFLDNPEPERKKPLLSRNQKSRLRGLLAAILVFAVLGSIGYFIFWATETSAVSHFCSGTTGTTVTQDNGGDTTVSVNLHDPKCHGNALSGILRGR